MGGESFCFERKEELKGFLSEYCPPVSDNKEKLVRGKKEVRVGKVDGLLCKNKGGGKSGKGEFEG